MISCLLEIVNSKKVNSDDIMSFFDKFTRVFGTKSDETFIEVRVNRSRIQEFQRFVEKLNQGSTLHEELNIGDYLIILLIILLILLLAVIIIFKRQLTIEHSTNLLLLAILFQVLRR